MNESREPEARKTILLVEDEAIVALSERVLLERQGYEAIVAGSGEEAVSTMETRSVDLVLMDIDLGADRMDGTKTAQLILESHEVPIVFLTSHSEREMVERVRGITRYGYVLKSSGEFVLIQAIETAFELFEANQKLLSENRSLRLAEKELQQRNHFIQTILDNLPIGLAVNYIDDGKASYMNRQFEAIYGWPSDVIADIPTFFESVYPDPAYRKQMSERINADMASGDPERMVWRDVRITRQSGETAYVDAVNIPIYDQNYMISTVIDVSEQHETLSALSQSEARYRAVAQSLPNGLIALYDTDLRFVMAGGSELEDGPLSAQDFVGKRLRDIYPPEIADRDEPSLLAALRGETTDQIVGHEGRYHRVITAPVYDGDEVRNGLVLTQDITEAQIAVHNYESTLEVLNVAIGAAELGVWTIDMASNKMERNDILLAMYGLERSQVEENPDLWRECVHEDDRARIEDAFDRVMSGERISDLHYRVRLPDGEIRHLVASGSSVHDGAEISRVIGVSVDVTDAVRREHDLADALAHRETLMREANHRIKNSLLTVQSLLTLAEERAVDTDAITRQISSIAAVHDLLGRAEHMEHVEVGALVHDVAQPHREAIEKRRAQLEIACAEHFVPSRIAVPVALIVNELVTNAVRHGLRDHEGGFVKVVTRSLSDELVIRVENDGERFPDEPNRSRSGSIGWDLVEALSAQVDAQIEVDREPHTVVALRVPGASLSG